MGTASRDKKSVMLLSNAFGSPSPTAQHRGRRTSAGIRTNFRGSAPRNGFGIRWIFPTHPVLTGNANRWTAAFDTSKRNQE